MIAEIGEIEKQVVRQLALNREMPCLHVAGAVVGRNIANLRICRVESCGRGEIIRETESRRPEAGARRVVYRCTSAGTLAWDLIDDGIYYVRTVIGQKIFAAQAVELHVTNTVRAANDHLRSNPISQA